MQEVREATEFMYKEVIPRFANRLDKTPLEEASRLVELLHSEVGFCSRS